MADPNCPKCGGSGWIVAERNGISGAERCHCGLQQRSTQLLEHANIPPLYRNATLETFSIPHDNPTAHNALAHVLNLVRTYTRDFPATDKPGLLFIGDPGTGKTHLAVAALQRLIARGFEGVFYDYQNLLNSIKAGYNESSNTSDREAYQSAMEAEVLLLDDLGAHRVTDWVEDTVTSIITYRCNHKKALIATTNLKDGDAGISPIDRSSGKVEYGVTLADRVGMRARSRLFEMCRIIRMPLVEDYRIKRK